MISAFFPFFYYLFIGAMTPGPNNVMLTASGMNFGYRKTVPHIAGIMGGYTTLLMLCVIGVGAAVKAFPELMFALKYFGAAYLLYLSYKIVMAGRIGLDKQRKSTARPLSFFEAYAFQFVNPKALVFALSSMSLLPENTSMIAMMIAAFIAGILCSGISTNCWALIGQAIAKVFRDDKIRLIINLILAALLLATLPLMIS
ncbi:MAG: hypothetical protein CBB87_09830 [Micavibrio sp. TMED27]|nr:lysine transporter LysE [Micavibrio sp.]OUT90433.1 MAG: hypothetical protein CBB87_09830 [Micavibrio sp. TMED27]|tara:strand:- start:24 stop:623 length:600 start_codon:yes stop_codon:yes gene_type:complete